MNQAVRDVEAALRPSYEEEMRRAAANWLAQRDRVRRLDQEHQKLETERKDQRAKLEALEKQLSKYVGSNITRRIFRVPDEAKVVLVEYRDEKWTSVTEEPVV